MLVVYTLKQRLILLKFGSLEMVCVEMNVYTKVKVL